MLQACQQLEVPADGGRRHGRGRCSSSSSAACGIYVFGIFCKRPDHCVEDSILAASPADWSETGIVCE